MTKPNYRVSLLHSSKKYWQYSPVYLSLLGHTNTCIDLKNELGESACRVVSINIRKVTDKRDKHKQPKLIWLLAPKAGYFLNNLL